MEETIYGPPGEAEENAVAAAGPSAEREKVAPTAKSMVPIAVSLKSTTVVSDTRTLQRPASSPSRFPALFLDSSLPSRRLQPHATVVQHLQRSMDFDFPNACGEIAQWSDGIRRTASAPIFKHAPEVARGLPNPRGPSSAEVVAMRRRPHDLVKTMRPLSALSNSPTNTRRGSQMILEDSPKSPKSPSSGRRSPVYTAGKGVRGGILGKHIKV